MRMARLMAVLLVAAVFLGGLAGCKRSEVAAIGANLADWRQTEEMPGVAPVEFTPAESSDFSQALGFSITSLPDAGRYTAGKYFVIDDWFGQMEFETADGRTLVLRVTQESKLLSGTYPEAHNVDEHTYEIDGIDVRVRTGEGGCGMASWKKGEFQYLLHANKKYGIPTEQEITDMVRGLDAAPA